MDELCVQGIIGWESLRCAGATFSTVNIFEQELIIIRNDNPDAESAAKEEKKETPDER